MKSIPRPLGVTPLNLRLPLIWSFRRLILSNIYVNNFPGFNSKAISVEELTPNGSFLGTCPFQHLMPFSLGRFTARAGTRMWLFSCASLCRKTSRQTMVQVNIISLLNYVKTDQWSLCDGTNLGPIPSLLPTRETKALHVIRTLDVLPKALGVQGKPSIITNLHPYIYSHGSEPYWRCQGLVKGKWTRTPRHMIIPPMTSLVRERDLSFSLPPIGARRIHHRLVGGWAMATESSTVYMSWKPENFAVKDMNERK